MNKICKLTVATLMFTIIFTATNLKAQEEDSDIGLTIGLDYVSNYLYRCQYRYDGHKGNGGVFSPYISYNVFNTGFSLGIRAEVSEMWFGSDTEEVISGQVDSFNTIGFNANYLYNYKDKVTLNLGTWYYRYKRYYDYDAGGLKLYSLDPSYLDLCFSVIVDMLPLRPMLVVTYSFFMDEKYYRGPDESTGVYGDGSYKNGNIYVQLGVGHSFELYDDTYLDLNAAAGFFDKNAFDNVIFGHKSEDISDIDLSAGVSTTADILTLSASFHYVIVPGTQYKYSHGRNPTPKDIHRFYAKFGVSCSI